AVGLERIEDLRVHRSIEEHDLAAREFSETAQLLEAGDLDHLGRDSVARSGHAAAERRDRKLRRTGRLRLDDVQAGPRAAHPDRHGAMLEMRAVEAVVLEAALGPGDGLLRIRRSREALGRRAAQGLELR